MILIQQKNKSKGRVVSQNENSTTKVTNTSR